MFQMLGIPGRLGRGVYDWDGPRIVDSFDMGGPRPGGAMGVLRAGAMSSPDAEFPLNSNG